MSLDIFVIVNSGRFPTAKEWAEAIKREGFNIVLDQSFDTRASSGFLPCPSSDRGFEYTFGPLLAEEITNFNFTPQQQAQVKTLDSSAGLHYKTDADFEVVQAASAVLAKLTDGLVVEAESGAVMTSMQAMAWARGDYNPEPSEKPYFNPKKTKLSIIKILQLVVLIYLICYQLYRWAKY